MQPASHEGTSPRRRPLSYTMGLPDFFPAPVRQFNRNIVVGGSVVLLHVAAALWALQSGLVRRPIEVVVPVVMVSEMLAPPAPQQTPATLPELQPAPPKVPEPVKQPRKAAPARPAAHRPVPVPAPAPEPEPPSGVEVMMPPPPAVAAAAAPAAAPVSAPAAAPAKVELPSSAADYLQNPAPAYPPISKRLGEQGKVLVRVLIGPDGAPQKAELKRSSGFDRLDRAALDYVMKCRYVPGKVGGVPQAMWHEAPVNFILE